MLCNYIWAESIPCTHHFTIPSCHFSRQISRYKSVFSLKKTDFQTPVCPEDPQKSCAGWVLKLCPFHLQITLFLPSQLQRCPIFFFYFSPSHLHLLYSHLPLELSSFLLVPSDSLVFTSLSISLELYCKLMGNLLFAHQLLQCTPAQ